MQYVRRVCGKIVSSYQNFMCTAGKKGFGSLLNINFVQKKIDSPRGQYTSFPLVMLKCCCLPGKLQKEGRFVASFVYKIDEIPAIFFKFGRLPCTKVHACTASEMFSWATIRRVPWLSSTFVTRLLNFAFRFIVVIAFLEFVTSVVRNSFGH